MNKTDCNNENVTPTVLFLLVTEGFGISVGSLLILTTFIYLIAFKKVKKRSFFIQAQVSYFPSGAKTIKKMLSQPLKNLLSSRILTF